MCDEEDNCPEDYNPNQEDFNSDDIGDACDGVGLEEESIRAEKSINDLSNSLKTIDIDIDREKSIIIDSNSNKDTFISLPSSYFNNKN